MSASLRPSDPPVEFSNGIAYTVEGAGQVTIMAVPGLPGSGRDFRWLAPALSDDFQVVRLDPPGYGRSERTTWNAMTTADRAATVRSLMDDLGLSTAVVIGHSAGGGVVAHLAREHPSRVSACVMISCTGPTSHFATGPMRLLAQPLRVTAVRHLLSPFIRRLYAAQGFPRYLTDDERAFALLDAAAFDFGAHRANLAGMRIPTMVVWAQDDPVIPQSRFQALADALPAGPRLVFADGGHNPQKTHAVHIASAIRDFIAVP